ncbi:PocR ligand-binding domain-containing protein [Clostridiaceae bacterium UIB06]|uniref:PocR ligand-binding domain-containing protein n=1 Tax=Clostridium thailandense TaxID=2794346 RepID=A0A949TZR3_9CLOT|nr:PocR ligand-binding domain-containing protein [Clostridium thailandense]MBV7274786.1 PocR ligand-binding domain-containing protein [Clostridium thailandense]MCH5137247.1 PocR ligand-binding domain-containing protein [Clostridiaceae bacterium UIB06]
MNDSKEYTLSEIIDIYSLQDIQDKFSKMTNLSAVTVDRFGTPITAPSNFTKFCNLLRTTKEGYRRCSNCDAEGGLKSMLLKKPIVYTCHAGLTDLTAPIIVNNVYLGAMLCGQVVIEEHKTRSLVNLKKLSIELDIPIEDLKAALNEIKSIKRNKIIDSADFLSMFANYIAEMGVANVTHAELLKETKEKMKFQQLVKDTQIKSIQSQVNPHFLFNTLNTIAGMALMEDSEKTAELIYSLSDILRYSIKNSEDMVEIGVELENIQKYLFIQITRYSDKLSYDIKIPDKILKYKIPSMTLQPLIENAIIHGLEPQNNPGKINVVGEILPDKSVLIKITDNGVGMSKEKLDMLLGSINSSGNSGGIGLKIVQDRLVYYFGDEFGIKIESSPHSGTTVYVKVPPIY